MSIVNPNIAGPCNHEGCAKPAEFNVCFALRVHDKHEPAVSTPIVQVCADHNDVEWKDIYSPAGWHQICEAFNDIGRSAPKVEFSYLLITPIEQP
jgi:hypothetical protein